MEIIVINKIVPKVRHMLAKDVSPWCKGINKKPNPKYSAKLHAILPSILDLGKHWLIITGGLKSTPIKCRAYRVFFKLCTWHKDLE